MYTILIAEDEKNEQDVILFLLNKYHFEFTILQAANGREALDILKDELVDILLTDIQMPFINGLELAASARNLNPNIELIFFSGYDDFEYVKTALSLRAVNYILKPVNPDEFKKSISEVLHTIKIREEATAESDKYIEERFFLKSQQLCHRNSEHEDTVSVRQDSELLKNIVQSLQLKTISELRHNTYLLLDKYKNTPNVSYIYIRYLCTTLLQLLMNALPETDKNNFKNVAEEIYTFRHFLDIRKFIEGFLENVITQMDRESQSPKHAIHLVKEYIHAHYKEELSLNSLASIVFLSPKYLSSMFIQVTDISLNKYIKNIRMEKAKELLLTTNMKVVDICQEVGYSYVSYFCKSFQESFGVTPDKFRQNRGNGECNT